MPSSTVNICVLTLVLLSFQQICHCRPHSRAKRGLVKDYFVPDPLVFTSDKFEKGEDGKYYLKKSAHRLDSEVKYSSAGKAESGNNVVSGDLKASDDTDIAKDESKTVQIGNTGSEPLKEELTEKVSMEVTPTSAEVEEMKFATELSSNKPAAVIEEAKSIEISDKKAPFTPIEPKFAVLPKPDSKDEIPLKTELPPTEEKIEGKISIGEVPDLYSRLVPVPGTFRLPVIIPVRQVSYGAVKVMPLPPADVSDRLPMPYEDDIIGEGAHESESEVVSQPLAEGKRESGYHLGNPLAMGVHLPMLSFRNFMTGLKETDKKDTEKQSKVVDVLGKKFLMQSNIMKYPTGDDSHMYLRFLSVKPLDEVKPLGPKEAAPEVAEKRKEMTELEVKKEETLAKEKGVVKKEKDVIESEMAKEKEEELLKESEILKAEETEIKMNVEQDVPKEVILENMGKSEMEKKMEQSAKGMNAENVPEEAKMLKEGHSVAINSKVNPAILNEEKIKTALAEESESRVVEKKLKGDEGIEEKKDYEKKMETVDAVFIKEDAGKEMEIPSKKDLFLVEKKKEEKSIEESEGEKPRKKNEKKKKKCKCEEKDSDSDEEDE